jgi:hypothetical protein
VLPHFRQTLAFVHHSFQQEPLPSTPSHTHVIDIHYVTTSINEWMRCPCSLYESLDHFTYQCPTIIEYSHCQMALIQNPTPPQLPSKPIITLTPSPDVVHIFSPEPEALLTLPWFLDSFYEDLPPNPPNSLVIFLMEILHSTIIFNPQYLDIWFMSSEPMQPPYIIIPTSSPEYIHTMTVTNVIPLDPLYSRQFHYDEDILEELTSPNFPWDPFHHKALFLSQEAFQPPTQGPIYSIKTKYFIQLGHID